MAKYDKGKMQASETEAKKYGLTLPYIPGSKKPSWTDRKEHGSRHVKGCCRASEALRY